MNTVIPKNPCYVCDIHISGANKGVIKECQTCKKRFAYVNAIHDSDYLTYDNGATRGNYIVNI